MDVNLCLLCLILILLDLVREHYDPVTLYHLFCLIERSENFANKKVERSETFLFRTQYMKDIMEDLLDL